MPTVVVGGKLVRDQEDSLLNATPGVVFAANTANIASDVYTYTVPQGQTRVLLPGHFFAALLQTAVPAEITDVSRIVLEKRSPSGSIREVVWNGNYQEIQSFVDSTLKARIPRVVRLEQGELLVIVVTATTVIATANSNFKLQSRLLEIVRL